LIRNYLFISLVLILKYKRVLITMTERGKDARQTEAIIKAWPYKKEDIEEYCKHLGKNLNELNYSEAELMIYDLKLMEYVPKR
jgi:hypothetical protein